MEIDGKIVAVAKGDHVHTPLEVAHGVENTHPTENLRVFLTFIKRGNE
jgi:mannose-6-phosphate isomerase-like protein (cupin superfamily)